jgi:FkbM family methyltransferase
MSSAGFGSFIKSAAREWLPPVAWRALRKAARGDLAVRDPMGIRAHDERSTTLNDGQVVHHRGSLADRGVVEQIFLARDYDVAPFRRHDEIVDFHARCAAPLVVDCGANIGASALWFARTYPKATVCAIEPEGSNFAFLQRNCAGLRVLPVQGAIAATPGTLQLHDPGEGEWGFRTGTEQAGPVLCEVRAYTLAELVALAGDCTPFILKIDIEGAEADLFRTGAALIDRFPLLVIELHDWMLPHSASSRPFLQWHAERDRDFVFRGENVFSFSNTLLGVERPVP